MTKNTPTTSTGQVKKLLFLDVDGVMNSAETVMASPKGTPVGINPYLAFLVGKIVLDTDCKIVVSSTWRNSEAAMADIVSKFPQGTVIGKTPNKGNYKDETGREIGRGREVEQWLMENQDLFDDIEGVRYAILDDDSDFYETQPLFKTTWAKGITPEIAQKVTDYLNGNGTV